MKPPEVVYWAEPRKRIPWQAKAWVLFGTVGWLFVIARAVIWWTTGVDILG